jgi:hypothetical protein
MKKKKKLILQLEKHTFFTALFLAGPLALHFKDDL